MIQIVINGRPVRTDAERDMPLLWLLRDELALTGTKYGCGAGQCGACSVLVDDAPALSCRLPLSACAGRRITTIEGLSDGEHLHPVQRAWLDAQVPQCGYCQPGIIMQVAGLLATTPQPTDAQIDEAVFNLCRCGTYARIRPAVHAAARALAQAQPQAPARPPR